MHSLITDSLMPSLVPIRFSFHRKDLRRMIEGECPSVIGPFRIIPSFTIICEFAEM
ncbi:MAG: hypothetical protein QOJ91_2615 [Sphingomonadales bacterium]|nr:hypothetical protein [Sphingomonadales bacterium]